LESILVDGTPLVQAQESFQRKVFRFGGSPTSFSGCDKRTPNNPEQEFELLRV